jgi:HSP20 family protein
MPAHRPKKERKPEEEEEEERWEEDWWRGWRFPSWRRRFGWGFRDIFEDIDKEFRRIQRQVDDIFRRALRGELPKPGEGGPFVYGFSMRIGPDGKPHFQEFGNVGGFFGRLRGARPRLPSERREPLTEVIEGENEVSITMELPGVEKKDIDLNLTDSELRVIVDTPTRKYQKYVELPPEIDPETVKATYKNGVLDITIKYLAPEKKKKGKRIEIK